MRWGLAQGEYPSPEEFVEEAVKLVDEAEKEGITLRIMGALAIFIHSPEYQDLYLKFGRLGGKVFTDIDFMSLSKCRSKIPDFFTARGYTYNPMILRLHGKKRHIYYGKRIPMVDVFFDKLEMCHTIDFRNRLHLDKPTIPLADILLEKMQIVEINEKDIIDSIVLLRAHELGDNDNNVVNVKYIAKLMSQDWGFYYTTTMNLKKLKQFLPKYDVLTDEDKNDVASKIDTILEAIEKEPKSMGWKMRAKIGPSKKWYRDVEEVLR